MYLVPIVVAGPERCIELHVGINNFSVVWKSLISFQWGTHIAIIYQYHCGVVAGDQFTIQWDKVHNHDHVENGTFTFQLSLFKNGDIHFVYREVSSTLLTSDNV